MSREALTFRRCNAPYSRQPRTLFAPDAAAHDQIQPPHKPANPNGAPCTAFATAVNANLHLRQHQTHPIRTPLATITIRKFDRRIPSTESRTKKIPTIETVGKNIYAKNTKAPTIEMVGAFTFDGISYRTAFTSLLCSSLRQRRPLRL